MGKIYAIVGMSGTGKSVAVDYLKEKGMGYIYLGGYVLKEVKKRGLECIQENEKKVREELRESGGMGAILELALPDIYDALEQSKNLVLDGVYSFSEYIKLKELFGENLLVIAIHTPKELRYKRLSQRAVRPLDKEGVDKRDTAEIMFIEKGGPIAIADIHIINDGNIQEFHSKVENILK